MSSLADELFANGPHWQPPDGGALRQVTTRAESPKSGHHDAERRHSSSAGSSIRSTSTTEGNGSQGRRTRPSIVSASASLATVKEKEQNRAANERTMSSFSTLPGDAADVNRSFSSTGLSSISLEKCPLAQLQWEENVVSSKKVSP